MTILDDTKHLSYVEFPLPGAGATPLGLRQCNDTLDHGTTVWDSAKALAQHLHALPGGLRGMRCIELGAGCGLVGLTAGACGASQVHLTDLPSVVKSVLEPNLKRNLTNLKERNHGVDLSVDALDWLNAPCLPVPLEEEPDRPFDLIFAADCVYERSLLEPLVDLMTRLAGPRTVAYVAFERRDSMVCDRFVDLCRSKSWDARPIPKRQLKNLRLENDEVEIWKIRCS
ncbi:putative methyltransferase-domain-containing protein [Piptocephalis cylindrospora]|uniref:Putative methyltransferase-domain-containing protein n=1 Tax=Piptocephalis cylindrospora TaxID=1907219 RepID=A0A4P9Y5G7_9FUNG|nr:putative methyltransferase-domain-containing protein [Piptocephalis cylindrospora]|eukprot:RKP13962.1 putative methyltransferase-domain-containing protein [Piptocephalis cylindrospora]